MTDPCPALILARIRRITATARRNGVMIHPDELDAIIREQKV